MWQSNVIGAIQLVFAISMWPTLSNPRAQVPRRTSVTTSCGLWVIGAVYVSLELWTAVAMASICAAAWTFVAIYRPVKEVQIASPHS